MGEESAERGRERQIKRNLRVVRGRKKWEKAKGENRTGIGNEKGPTEATGTGGLRQGGCSGGCWARRGMSV